MLDLNSILSKPSGKILILAPHTDDAELGCGGTMARLLEEGVEIHVAAFSTAEESVPEGESKDTLRNEFLAAMSIMGIPRNNLHVYGFPVRRLNYYRQDVLEQLIQLKGQIDPSAVFLPSCSDLHQDHQVLNIEGLRAFKERTVFGYELPWNHISYSANAFVTLDIRHIEKKWECLQAYRSQIKLNRPYFTREFHLGLAKIRGVQVKSEYAESFEIQRLRI